MLERARCGEGLGEVISQQRMCVLTPRLGRGRRSGGGRGSGGIRGPGPALAGAWGCAWLSVCNVGSWDETALVGEGYRLWPPRLTLVMLWVLWLGHDDLWCRQTRRGWQWVARTVAWWYRRVLSTEGVGRCMGWVLMRY